jgi:putative nucleotidyltransferase with HDIG domain
MSLQLSRPEAWSLFCEWTHSPSLRKHVLAVEAAMRAYARRFESDEELWGITGLLHDLDYERHPDLETGHPRIALEELERRGYPPELVRRWRRTRTASASRATARWRRRSTRSTSCVAS